MAARHVNDINDIFEVFVAYDSCIKMHNNNRGAQSVGRGFPDAPRSVQ